MWKMVSDKIRNLNMWPTVFDKIHKSKFFEETTFNGINHIATAQSKGACSLWFFLWCATCCFFVYEFVYELTELLENDSKITFRMAKQDEIDYPEVKFCYEHWTQWTINKNYTDKLEPSVIFVLPSLFTDQHEITGSCEFNDLMTWLKPKYGNILNFTEISEAFMNISGNLKHDSDALQRSHLYFDRKRLLPCIVFKSNQTSIVNLTMYIPFAYSLTYNVRDAAARPDSSPTFRIPGAVYMNDQWGFSLSHITNTEQKVDIRPKATISRGETILPHCEKRKQTIISPKKPQGSTANCTPAVNESNSVEIELLLGETPDASAGCPDWRYTVDNMKISPLPNKGYFNNFCKLVINFPLHSEWLITEHHAAVGWLEIVSNIGGSLGLWTGGSVLSIIHMIFYFFFKESVFVAIFKLVHRKFIKPKEKHVLIIEIM